MKCFALVPVFISAVALAQPPLSAKPDISFVEFVQSLTPEERQALKKQADGALQRIIPNQELRATLVQDLGDQIDHPDPEKLAHFPTVSLALFRSGILQELLPEHEGVKPALGAVQIHDFKKAMAEAQRPRQAPSATSFSPRLKYGHFPNAQIGDLEHSQSVLLSEILNALSRQDGSYADWGSYRIWTAVGLVERLLTTDHAIEFRDERTYANFFSFTVDGDKNLRWPMWIDTGLRVGKQNEPLVIPAGHSQFAWEIRGPIVNARVMFFLGISGAGFFPQVDERPAWTGLHAVAKSKKPFDVTNTFAAAVDYLRLNDFERKTIAAGLPADGYGVVGTCNDSVALLEALSGFPNQVYPLIRLSGLRSETQDPVILQMYRELAEFPLDYAPQPNEALRRDQLRRISAMNPFPRGQHPWDTKVGELMNQVRAALK